MYNLTTSEEYNWALLQGYFGYYVMGMIYESHKESLYCYVTQKHLLILMRT